MRLIHKAGISAIALHATLLAASGAQAAQQAAATDDGIQDIVVTAQKRAENLQNVPISIYALSGDSIEKAGINDVYDLATYAPSFKSDNVGPADPTFTMRGIGSNERGAGSDRSVVVFLDDIYIGRSAGTVFELYDIERIEMLRGPQGTLSGRNVVGGAINIITKKPTEDFSGAAEVTLGNYNLRQAKARVNGKLADGVAASLSFTTRDRDGFYTYAPTGKDTDGISSTNLRSKVAITASENLEILLSGDVSRFRQDGVSAKPFGVGNYTKTTLGYTPLPDPWTVETSRRGYAEVDLWGLSARADLTTDAGILTSITGFRHVKSDSAQDSIGLPAGYFLSYLSAAEKSDFFSQELRLASLPDSGPLTWVVGLYFLKDSVNRIEGYDRDFKGQTSKPIWNQDARTTSISGFAQGTYKLTDQLNFTAGARYTHDNKRLHNILTDASNGTSTNGLTPGISAFDIMAEKSFNAFTPKVTIDFAPSEAALIYATVSKGFKSGGFQGLAPTAAAATTSFFPEIAWNYEIGAKTRWFDNRLQVNLAGFYMDYKDLQVSNRILTIPGDQSSALRILTNASDAVVKGVELEVLARPFAGLTLSGNYAYLDTEVKNFILGTDGTDLSGNELGKAPKNAFTLSGNYVHNIDDQSDISFHADYVYQSSMFFFIENTVTAKEPSYGILNGRITYTLNDWSFTVYGRNITDKLYRTKTVPVGDGAFSGFGDPATYGVTVGYKF
jgi:iron complex outermembrane receptor protein